VKGERVERGGRCLSHGWIIRTARQGGRQRIFHASQANW
jgi:hypothetical protein